MGQRMQLAALGKEGEIIYADSAERGVDYLCAECGQAVRRRGGAHRRDHFYHQAAAPGCRSSGKGMVHLQVQLAIIDSLPPGEAFLEKKFTSINRVADICWESEKLIFEVQCSSIARGEVIGRNRDYRSLGYEVVWILHDARYNKRRLSGAEEALKEAPHYYTDIDREGKGKIYDQIYSANKGVRRLRSARRGVSLGGPKRVFPFKPKESSLIGERMAGWRCYFSGDMIDRFFSGEVEEWLVEGEKRGAIGARLANLLNFSGLYSRYFRLFLEKMCR